MLNQIEALVEAAKIVRDARCEVAGTSTAVWQKLDRIYNYIDKQVQFELDTIQE